MSWTWISASVVLGFLYWHWLCRDPPKPKPRPEAGPCMPQPRPHPPPIPEYELHQSASPSSNRHRSVAPARRPVDNYSSPARPALPAVHTHYLVNLYPGTVEYDTIQEVFNKHSTIGKRKLKVTSVELVINPALSAKYEAKRQDYKWLYGHVKEEWLFHGTPTKNIPSIIRDNFDVERHGRHVGHRFGAGVSFSAMASYAYHYCDGGKAMLLCKVLISNVVEVEEKRKYMPALRQPPLLPGRFPPLRYDTTAKNSKTLDVAVKFEANSFLPLCVIRFIEVPKRSHHGFYLDDSD